MADLSQLFKYAPTTAGFFLGGQLADDTQKRALEREGLGHDNRAKQQT